MIKDVNCKYSGQIFRINIPNINSVEIKDIYIMKVCYGEAKYLFLIFGGNIHWKYSTEDT